jgi:hypothetical protein
VEFLGEA